MKEKVDPKTLRLFARMLIAILRVLIGGKEVEITEEKEEGGKDGKL